MELCLGLAFFVMIFVAWATLARSEGDRRESVSAGEAYPESFSNSSWAIATIAVFILGILAVIIFGCIGFE